MPAGSPPGLSNMSLVPRSVRKSRAANASNVSTAARSPLHAEASGGGGGGTGDAAAGSADVSDHRSLTVVTAAAVDASLAVSSMVSPAGPLLRAAPPRADADLAVGTSEAPHRADRRGHDGEDGRHAAAAPDNTVVDAAADAASVAALQDRVAYLLRSRDVRVR
jgi:hypothetical protein